MDVVFGDQDKLLLFLLPCLQEIGQIMEEYLGLGK